MDTRTLVSVVRNWSYMGVELHIFQRPDIDHVSYVKSIEMETAPTAGVIPNDAPIIIDDGAAQRLIDDLWNCGYRPTNAKSGDQTVQAKDEHISDLRKILSAYIETRHA